ncbi:MAG: efflux RND transporter periplasmic adaptor subunit [bacterium]|nr:efflux RND transporter periplasmic adaptor subunit [bacterium]
MNQSEAKPNVTNNSGKRLFQLARKRWYLTLIILVVLGYWGYRSFFGVSDEYATAEVKRGTFKIEVTETGVVRAVKSVSVVAPKSQTTLQIIDMVPEGTTVNVGDLLIQFDPTELQKKIDDKSAELEIAQANLQKFRSEMESNRAKSKGELESADAQFKQAKLRLQQMEFEAEVKKEEERLAMRQAEISYEQARARIVAQLTADSADLRTLELKIKQAQLDLDKAHNDLKDLRIEAKQPGLVVYLEMWKGNNMAKIQVGDQPWRGMSLLEIPDLSSMEAKIEVNEVEVARITKGAPAKIVLDAFPDPAYTGKVKEISVLARRKENDENVKVFDVVVSIDSASSMMKPGITATVAVLAEETANAVYVPIDAIETDSLSYVYVVGTTGSKRTQVKLGKRNDDFVVIESGVEPGQKVRLLSKKVKSDDEEEKPEATTSVNKSQRVVTRGR